MPRLLFSFLPSCYAAADDYAAAMPLYFAGAAATVDVALRLELSDAATLYCCRLLDAAIADDTLTPPLMMSCRYFHFS